MLVKNGKFRYFRNNISGLEIDAIIVNDEGKYDAIEIKLGVIQIDKAKSNLIKFYEKMDKKTAFMWIACSTKNINDYY